MVAECGLPVNSIRASQSYEIAGLSYLRVLGRKEIC